MKCLKCGAEANCIFTSVECSNRSCEDFSYEYSAVNGQIADLKRAIKQIENNHPKTVKEATTAGYWNEAFKRSICQEGIDKIKDYKGIIIEDFIFFPTRKHADKWAARDFRGKSWRP